MEEVIGSSYRTATDLGLPDSFTIYHGRLLDLCLMTVASSAGSTSRRRKKNKAPPPLERDGEILTPNDILALSTMVEMEFVASLKQDLSETKKTMTGNTEPHVFDVFLMKAAKKGTDTSTTGPTRRGSSIAVCVPYRKKLMWWNGISMEDGGQLWSLSTSSHLRRISSLSGSARVLQALDTAWKISTQPPKNDGKVNVDLMIAGMKREKILHVEEVFDANNGCAEIPLRAGSRLNKAQAQTVKALSVFNSGFFCIQGPPGCGKTTTMVEMIIAAMTRSSVIVVAPSNAAVANVALKLYETGLVPFCRMIVFGNNCHESVHFLSPIHRSRKYTQFQEAHDKQLHASPGEEPTPRQIAKAKKLLNDVVAWLHLPEKTENGKAWTNIDVQAQCPVLPMIEDGSLTKTGQAILSGLLYKADVVFSTLNSAGSFTLQSAMYKDGTKDCDKRPTETLMLDEGGQCTEAEFFIATTFPGIKRVVVMGDPKQLKPTVISPKCADNGFGESFLGRVYNRDERNLHLLDTQYRMDPMILRFPNTQFYGGEILNGENVYDRQPKVENPFLLVDTGLKGQEEQIALSWRNQYEVSVVNFLLNSDEDIKRLLQTGVNGETSVIIITPYKGQMELLLERVELPKGSKASIAINTVDAFQGQEGDVVILSTVRTKRAGFVNDAERINVALTRAKRVLRVVGEFSFFRQLAPNTPLRALADHGSNHRHGNLNVTKDEPSTCTSDVESVTNQSYPISTGMQPTITDKSRKNNRGSKEKHLNAETAVANAVPCHPEAAVVPSTSQTELDIAKGQPVAPGMPRKKKKKSKPKGVKVETVVPTKTIHAPTTYQAELDNGKKQRPTTGRFRKKGKKNKKK